MSKLFIYIVFCLSILAVPLYAQEEDVFGEELESVMDRYSRLNDSRNYLEAYREAVQTEWLVDAALTEKGINPSSLGDWEFTQRYWPVKKSKAETAYMLGIHTDMEAVANELSRELASKNLEDSQKDELYSDLAKIEGSCYYLKGKYDSAETALKRAITLRKDREDYEFNNFYAFRGDLAQLYYKKRMYPEALAQMDSILMHKEFQDKSRFTKENDIDIKRREVMSWRAITLAHMNKFCEALKEMDPIVQHYRRSTDKRLYAESLRKKAKILMLQYDATGKYDPVALSYYQEYLTLSKDYIDKHFVTMSESEREQYWMAEQPFVIDCYRLQDKAPELLYDVALYSKAVLLQMGRDFKEGMTEAERKEVLTSIRTTWKQVREKLPDSGCAIEFIVYEKKGENHIGALVVKKNSTRPMFIDISPTSAISDHMVNDVYLVKDILGNTQDRDMINALYNDSTFYGQIWNYRIINAIGRCQDVYFSPDGIFHQIGIEYMIPPSMAGKRFFRLTTTRLLTQQRQKVRTDKMMVCGGVEYGFSADDKETGNDALAYSLLASRDFSLSPLPGSATEIDSIQAVRQKHTVDKVLRADSVTETILHRLMNKYHIVHISTHGLFSEVNTAGTEIHPSSTDTQLSRSCLFLSGAEKNLKKVSFDASQHDGVLSARELAKMNLDNVDLAVMSACMSGLGYVTPDGVYGLQRGLKTAGVKAIISTLWSVDDEASSYFISRFYENLEAGNDLHMAFKTARDSLRQYEMVYGNTSSNTPTTGSFMQRRRAITVRKFNKPYFYNAFILIDGLE